MIDVPDKTHAARLWGTIFVWGSPGTLCRMGSEGEQRGYAGHLYFQLLELGEADDPRPPLRALLEGLVAITRAERGYLELYSEGDRREPRWALSLGCSPEEEREIRAVTSRGIVAAALASGSTVHSPYAMLDERFAEQSSVQDQRIEAVLCVRLGAKGPGVLYLEGRRGAGPFAPEAIVLAERIARHLGPTLERAARMEDARRRDPTEPFRQKLQVKEIAGRSQALADVLQQVAAYAPLGVTVLITGPIGTGKTQIARALHDNGPRKKGPFVEINCGAIPDTLVEAELFGTEQGAFSGAVKSRGKVATAEGGTLFLDEIAEIPFAAQSALLQVLQSRQYYPVGGSRACTANFRLIAATNADLAAMVDAKRFREDLLHRINVVQIRMPSLNQRHEDIGPLAIELIARIAAELDLPALPLSERARSHVCSRDWPGNIRELRNRLSGGLIHAVNEAASQIEVRHIDGRSPTDRKESTFHEATRAFQKELLRRELNAAGWNVTAVAEKLDITRSHVYNLINQFELKRTEKTL